MTLAAVGALLATILATGLTQAASATIVAQYYAFSPSPLTIVVGSTVTWVNKDANQLKIVSDTGAFPSSRLLNPGDKFSVKFSKAGTYNYYDGFGGFMKGTIIVTAAPKATPKATPRPTVKPTAKPPAAPTAAPTAVPSVTAEPTPTAIAGASSGPTDAATGSPTPGNGSSAAPGASGGDGSSAGSGSDSGSLDIGSILFGLALAVLLFFAWLGVQTFRRNRPGPPTGGGTGAGGASAGSGGSGGSGGGTGGGAAAASVAGTGPGATPDAVAPPTPPPTGAATTRRRARPAALSPDFDEDAPIGSG